jgi:hypothetical protein
MEKVLYVGLDLHKESIVVATAPQGDTAVHLYSQIGDTLEKNPHLDRNISRRGMRSGQAVARL